MTVEIEERNGRPWSFRATIDDHEEAFAEVPDELLVEAYEWEWTSRGLEPPATTVEQLRARILELNRAKAKRLPREIVLTVTEAAPMLRMTERTLRHEVDQGRWDEHLAKLPDGRRGLRFMPRPVSWKLVPGHRPDPRIVGQMARDRIQPGETYHPGYTRLASGEAWKAKW
jgi:hypothetical protein